MQTKVNYFIVETPWQITVIRQLPRLTPGQYFFREHNVGEYDVLKQK